MKCVCMNSLRRFTARYAVNESSHFMRCYALCKMWESGWYRGFKFVPLVLKGRFFYAFKTKLTKIFIEKEHMQ